MENRVPSDRIALSELRKEMEPFMLLSAREQEKTLHALFRRSVGEIPYGRDIAAATSSFAKAASSYSRVLSKASSGGYATARGMNIAISRTCNGFVRAMNGFHSMLGGAVKDLAKSLAASAFAGTGYAFAAGLAAREW